MSPGLKYFTGHMQHPRAVLSTETIHFREGLLCFRDIVVEIKQDVFHPTIGKNSGVVLESKIRRTLHVVHHLRWVRIPAPQ